MKIIASVYSLRLIAVVAVISIHTLPFSYDGWEIANELTLPIVVNQLARFAVPMFFVLSGYFWGTKIRSGEDLVVTSQVVVRRIFSVWLFWSAIYLIPYSFFSVEAYDITGRIKILHWYYWEVLKNPWHLLLNGSAGHLWFLVSLLMSVAISSVLVHFRQIRLLYVMAVVFFVLALLGKAYVKSPLGFLTDFDLRNGPFFGLLMFVSGYVLSRYKINQTWKIMGVGMTLTGGALQLLELQWLHQNFGTSYLQDFVASTALFGLGAAVLALSNANFLRIASLQQLGGLSLGLYAAQGIFIEMLDPAKSWLIQTVGGGGFTLAVFAADAMAVFAAARLPRLRQFLV